MACCCHFLVATGSVKAANMFQHYRLFFVLVIWLAYGGSTLAERGN
jgi:hypothetical protein